MRILDRYIVREIFRHAFLGLIVFTFVLFVPQLVRLMELLVRHSGSGVQVGKLFLYIFPGVLIFTIPMAVLVECCSASDACRRTAKSSRSPPWGSAGSVCWCRSAY